MPAYKIVKPSPGVVKSIIDLHIDKGIHKPAISEFYTFYVSYYHNHRFRYIDKFMAYLKKEKRATQEQIDSVLLLTDFYGLSKETFSDQCVITLQMVEWSIRYLHLPSNLMLIKLADFINNSEELNIFVRSCGWLKIADIPNNIKSKYLFEQIKYREKPIDLSRAIITFTQHPDFDEYKGLLYEEYDIVVSLTPTQQGGNVFKETVYRLNESLDGFVKNTRRSFLAFSYHEIEENH